MNVYKLELYSETMRYKILHKPDALSVFWFFLKKNIFAKTTALFNYV